MQNPHPFMVQDPVCGMTFDEKDTVGRVRHKKKVYYFCSPICETAFLKNPKLHWLSSWRQCEHPAERCFEIINYSLFISARSCSGKEHSRKTVTIK